MCGGGEGEGEGEGGSGGEGVILSYACLDYNLHL